MNPFVCDYDYFKSLIGGTEIIFSFPVSELIH